MNACPDTNRAECSAADGPGMIAAAQIPSVSLRSRVGVTNVGPRLSANLYSARIAINGSISVALSAGIRLAPIATSTKMAAIAANVTGSVELT